MYVDYILNVNAILLIYRLISGDVVTLGYSMAFQPLFLGNLVLVVVVCVSLHTELGTAALGGWLFLLIVSGPIQAWVGKAVQKASKAYITQSDFRVKFIGEMLRGIKVTKMYAWEKALMEQISNFRDKEMVQLFLRVKLKSIMTMLNIVCKTISKLK